eukprot:59541-Rhodomonas_salina.1
MDVECQSIPPLTFLYVTTSLSSEAPAHTISPRSGGLVEGSLASAGLPVSMLNQTFWLRQAGAATAQEMHGGANGIN